jgi:hypothetical protein
MWCFLNIYTRQLKKMRQFSKFSTMSTHNFYKREKPLKHTNSKDSENYNMTFKNNDKTNNWHPSLHDMGSMPDFPLCYVVSVGIKRGISHI